MSKFLHADDNQHNDDVKAIAIPRVFYKNSLSNKQKKNRGPWGTESLYWHWLASKFSVKENTYKT